MEALLRSLNSYQPIIYFVLSLGALLLFQRALSAWLEWRRSVFGLEKELAFQRLRVFGAGFIILLMFGLSVFCLSTFILPIVPFKTLWSSPTPDLLSTKLAGETQVAQGTQLPTAIVTPMGTTGCMPNQLIISSFNAGDEIGGQVIISGTVDLPNFGFYVYQYAPRGSDEWTTISAGDKPVRNDAIGAWDTTSLVPGDYLLRILVTDNLNTPFPPCVFPVRIIPPTPRPPQ